MISCPDCPEPGFDFITTAPTPGPHLCRTCGGAGEITEEHGRRIALGKDIRRMRVDVLGWSQRDAAETLRVSAKTLSAFERGDDLFPDTAIEVHKDLARRLT